MRRVHVAKVKYTAGVVVTRLISVLHTCVNRNRERERKIDASLMSVYYVDIIMLYAGMRARWFFFFLLSIYSVWVIIRGA